MRIPISRPAPATVIALVALFVALGGTGFAVVNTGIPDRQGVFHACVNNQTGAVRLVRSGGGCRRPQGHGAHRFAGEQPVAWSQAGRPGPGGSSTGYFAQAVAGSLFTRTVRLAVPPGDYIANGDCTAEQDSPSPTQSTTTPMLGGAFAILTAVPKTGNPNSQPGYVSRASVPNTGALGSLPEPPAVYGTASLSEIGSFSLPTGGMITETCENQPSPRGFGGSAVHNIKYGDLHLNATAVAAVRP